MSSDIELKAHTAEPIDFDLPCPNCSYNLRERRLGDRCPECGTLLDRDTLQTHPLAMPADAWQSVAGRLRLVRWGLVAVAAQMPLLLLLNLLWYSRWIQFVDELAFAMPTLGYLMIATATWGLTSDQWLTFEGRKERIVALLLRWSMVGSVGFSLGPPIIRVFAVEAGGDAPFAAFAMVTSVITGFVITPLRYLLLPLALACAGLHARTLARRFQARGAALDRPTIVVTLISAGLILLGYLMVLIPNAMGGLIGGVNSSTAFRIIGIALQVLVIVAPCVLLWLRVGFILRSRRLPRGLSPDDQDKATRWASALERGRASSRDDELTRLQNTPERKRWDLRPMCEADSNAAVKIERGVAWLGRAAAVVCAALVASSAAALFPTELANLAAPLAMMGGFFAAALMALVGNLGITSHDPASGEGKIGLRIRETARWTPFVAIGALVLSYLPAARQADPLTEATLFDTAVSLVFSIALTLSLVSFVLHTWRTTRRVRSSIEPGPRYVYVALVLIGIHAATTLASAVDRSGELGLSMLPPLQSFARVLAIAAGFAFLSRYAARVRRAIARQRNAPETEIS